MSRSLSGRADNRDTERQPMPSQPDGLEGKEASKHTVDHWMIDLVLRLTRASKECEQLSTQPDWDEHHSIGVADPFDDKPGVFNLPPEFGQTVAALMPRLIVIRSPKKIECGHEDDSRRAWSQNAFDLAKALQIVVQVLDYIERGYKVKRGRREG